MINLLLWTTLFENMACLLISQSSEAALLVLNAAPGLENECKKTCVQTWSALSSNCIPHTANIL